MSHEDRRTHRRHLDRQRPAADAARALTLALIPGVAVATGLFLVAAGFQAAFSVAVWRASLPLQDCADGASGGAVGLLVLRLFRPGASLCGAVLRLAVPLLLLAAGVGVELVVVPAADGTRG